MWTWILWKQDSRRSEKHTAGLGVIRYQWKKNPKQQYDKKWDQDVTCQSYKERGAEVAMLRKLKIFLTMRSGFVLFFYHIDLNS